MAIQWEKKLKEEVIVLFILGQFDALLTNPGQFLNLVPKLRGFPTSSHQNSHANDIMMLYDITHKKILNISKELCSSCQILKLTS